MKIFSSFLLTTIAAISITYGEIIPVNTMQDALKIFQEADRDTLALFDIDMVILQPRDPAFQMANMKRYSPIVKKIMQQLPADKRDVFLVLTTISSETVLIDSKMPHLIEELTEKKVPNMALTGNFTGRFADIENMEEWKIKRLAQWGIDFSKGAPHGEKIVFEDLPSYRGRHSTYTSGVLFVNGSVCPKGDALIAFLKRTGYLPKKVIFIDDREDNLRSVESALLAFNPSIVFKGLHYTGAKDYPSPSISEQQFEAQWQEVAERAKSLL